MGDNGNWLLRKTLLVLALLVSIVMIGASCAQADFPPPPDQQTGAPTPEPDASTNPLHDIETGWSLEMPNVGFEYMLIIALFFTCLGMYSIQNRKISKKGSKLMLVGIVHLLILFVFLAGGSGFWMLIFSALPIFAQLLLIIGGYKNYRAYEKKLADRLRGIF